MTGGIVVVVVVLSSTLLNIKDSVVTHKKL